MVDLQKRYEKVLAGEPSIFGGVKSNSTPIVRQIVSESIKIFSSNDFNEDDYFESTESVVLNSRHFWLAIYDLSIHFLKMNNLDVNPVQILRNKLVMGYKSTDNSAITSQNFFVDAQNTFNNLVDSIASVTGKERRDKANFSLITLISDFEYQLYAFDLTHSKNYIDSIKKIVRMVGFEVMIKVIFSELNRITSSMTDIELKNAKVIKYIEVFDVHSQVKNILWQTLYENFWDEQTSIETLSKNIEFSLLFQLGLKLVSRFAGQEQSGLDKVSLIRNAGFVALTNLETLSRERSKMEPFSQKFRTFVISVLGIVNLDFLLLGIRNHVFPNNTFNNDLFQIVEPTNKCPVHRIQFLFKIAGNHGRLITMGCPAYDIFPSMVILFDRLVARIENSEIQN